MNDYMIVADALKNLTSAIEDYLKAVKNHMEKFDGLTNQALYEAEMELNDCIKTAKEVM